jgi:hypothetical protein
MNRDNITSQKQEGTPPTHTHTPLTSYGCNCTVEKNLQLPLEAGLVAAREDKHNDALGLAVTSGLPAQGKGEKTRDTRGSIQYGSALG